MEVGTKVILEYAAGDPGTIGDFYWAFQVIKGDSVEAFGSGSTLLKTVKLVQSAMIQLETEGRL